MIRAVLETNVVVSALLSPFGNEAQVLDAVRAGALVPCFSDEMLTEYGEVLARPKFAFAPQTIPGLLAMLRSMGAEFRPDPAPGTSPDASDEPFIACALAAHADFLVTGNKRHFPAAAYGKARVVSAKELLEQIPPGAAL
jgi:putative PIN family toxin of toxin-antitoxin system